MDRSTSLYQQVIEPIEDRMIRAIWCITRNAQDAEDAMQDALLAIWKLRQRLLQHANPPALVLKICVDAAYDCARKRARDRCKMAPHDATDGLADNARLPWEELAQRELATEILAAINQLSRRQAVAITLRVFEELPYEEIAAAMNCSEATARKHVERARRHLRVVLANLQPDRITEIRQ
jgi:RNA polymerase sigma-70 factor (ECF subfamily)